MGKNNKVTFEFGADVKNLNTGLNSVTKSINTLTKEIHKNKFTKITQSVAALGAAFGATTSAIRNVCNALVDLEQVALKQIKAERQLETAAKNNPYLNKESVTNLKNYASELQKIGTIGDEELLPMMAELASAGRTQAEIQDIMSAALDVSASGTMSLESAVTNLNKTYNGTTGELGKLLPGVKNLTKEQLQNGDAVKVVAAQYKGMSKEVTQATGSAQQLANAWGDFKENIGKGFEKPLSILRNKITEIITKINEANSKADQAKQDAKDVESGTATSEQIQRRINEQKEQLELLNNAKGFGGYKVSKTQQEAIDKRKQSIQEYITELEAQYNEQKKVEAQEEKNAKAKAERTAKENERTQNNNRVQEIQNEYAQSIESVKKNIEYRKQAGEVITEESERQEILNAKVQGYIKARTEAGTLMSDSNAWVKVTLSDIEAEADALDELAQKKEEVAETKNDDVTDQLIEKWTQQTVSEIEALKQELALLKERQKILQQTGADTTQVEQAILACSDAIKQAEQAAQQADFKKMINNVKSITDTVASSLQSLGNSITSITNTAIQENTQETSKAKEDLKEQYEAGLLSYEEYQDKKDEIEKEAAQKEYKIKMAQWIMNLSIAQAQAAQAVVNALASGVPPLNIINATTAGLLGTAQIIAMVGSKPQPPSFSTGGFLTGNSYSGDKIPFMGNAGEAILNPAEQRNFLDIANGTYNGGIVLNMPINIENNAADTVSVSAQSDERQIRLTVEKATNASLKAGRLNNGLQAANASMSGIKLL